MKKSVKRPSAKTKFFNDRIKDIENLTTNIPSREDIVLTRSRSSTDNTDIPFNDLKQLVEEYTKTWKITKKHRVFKTQAKNI